MFRQLILTATLCLTALPALAAGDPAEGKRAFNSCRSCHGIASDSETFFRVNAAAAPNLYGVIGRQAGTGDFRRYGDDLVAAGEAGLVWTEELLAEYIENPRDFLRAYLDDPKARSNMAFLMRKNQEDIAAFLATFSE